MLAVMSECGDNPFQYVDPVYRLPVYMRVWETKFNPIPHQDYWADPQWTLMPNVLRLREVKRGRASMSRIPNKMDISDRRLTARCSEYQQTGHDRRTCPARLGR